MLDQIFTVHRYKPEDAQLPSKVQPETRFLGQKHKATFQHYRGAFSTIHRGAFSTVKGDMQSPMSETTTPINRNPDDIMGQLSQGMDNNIAGREGPASGKIPLMSNTSESTSFMR